MKRTEYIYDATIERVVDGDTYEFRVIDTIDHGFDTYSEHSQLITVRLANGDTPEIFRPKSPAEREHGKAAAAFVSSVLFEDNPVVVKIRTIKSKKGKDKKGSFHRYLAYVTLPNGADLGEMLAENDLLKRDDYI